MFTPSGTLPTVKLGIYRSSSIGDVVLATACLKLLEDLNVPVEVTWVGRGASLQLIAAAYPHLRILEVNPAQPNYQEQLVKSLNGLHFILDLQVSFRSRAIMRMLSRQYQMPIYSWEKNSTARSKMVFQARLRGRRRSLPPSMQTSRRHQFESMVEGLKRALRVHLPVESLDGIDRKSSVPFLPTEHEHMQRPWQKELKFGQWLAVAPGAAHATKKAPEALFLDILTRLRHQYGKMSETGKELGLLFVGNESDRDEALSITDQLGWRGPVLNLAGKLSLWESALAIREVDMILSNDSSLSHIGEAVATPSVVLFGPTVEAFGFDPWRPESQAFSSPLGCRPCSKHGKSACRYGDKLCFKLLSAASIANYIAKRLMQAQESNTHA